MCPGCGFDQGGQADRVGGARPREHSLLLAVPKRRGRAVPRRATPGHMERHQGPSGVEQLRDNVGKRFHCGLHRIGKARQGEEVQDWRVYITGVPGPHVKSTHTNDS